MGEARPFILWTAAWIALGAVTFVSLLWVAAPYGRHARRGWGPMVPAALGWLVMEAPSPALMAVFFFMSERTSDPASAAFVTLWLGHYIYRAFVFPFLGRGGKAPMPLSVAASAFGFNLVNGYVNGRWLFVLGPSHGQGWLTDPRFVLGVALFFVGFAIHTRADALLRRLRAPGDSEYRIPRGFLFDRVSCPNYMGEIVEWTGWAILTWSLAGTSFAIWTFANLVPRALSHHRWYRETFPDYPPQRRAIFPGLL